MPSPEETFSNLDADRNGRLDASEIDSNPFVSRLLRNSDTSRGMSRDDFLGEMQRIRENFGRGGRGGFGGPPGGPGGSDSDRRGDRGDRNGRRDGNPGENGNNGPGGDADGEHGTPDGSQPNAPTPQSPKPRPRVTIDLQQDLLPADSDRDGQVGLYEWRRAGRSLKEFNELDRNHDGFVTPREVALARPEPTPAPAVGQPATPPGTQPTPPANAPAGNTTATPGSESPANAAAVRDAERFLRLLDRNRDGQIAPDEWVDGNTKTLFTTGGVDLSQPMSAEAFSQHYLRLSAAR